MVELRRALQENSTVREPLLNARYEKEEVSALSCFISAHVLSRPAVSTYVCMDVDPAAVASRMSELSDVCKHELAAAGASLCLCAPQVMELYRMHLQNSEVPAKFSTLLQLRELLDIDGPEAEAMEVEVMQSGGYFSI